MSGALARIEALEREVKRLKQRATRRYGMPPSLHALSHADGGADELNVDGLSGVLADPQLVGVDPNGALDGDSATTPLAVRVDGVTIGINGSNELEALGALSLFGTVGAQLDTVGHRRAVQCPFAGTIILGAISGFDADGTPASGDAEVNVFKDATFPATTSIVASAPLTLTGDDNAEDATLTGWTLSIAAGDWIAFEYVSGDLDLVLAQLFLLRSS